MPNVSINIDNKGFNEALADTVRIMKKDGPKELMRQAKLLALAVASAAPPRIKGLKGLAAGIPKAKGDSRFKVIKRLVKPAYSMRVIDAVRMGNTDILYGIATTRKKPVFNSIGNANGSALQRILNAAATDTVRAMANLRKLLNGAPNGSVAQVYQDYNKASSAHYKRLLNKMGQSGLGSISQGDRVYLLEPINRERKKILAEYVPTVGTIKAGWVQAAMAIPSNAGRKPPSWLMNKKSVGSATVSGTGMKSLVTLSNTKGNAINFNGRVDYVGKAMRFRKLRMINSIKGFLLRTIGYSFRGDKYFYFDKGVGLQLDAYEVDI